MSDYNRYRRVTSIKNSKDAGDGIKKTPTGPNNRLRIGEFSNSEEEYREQKSKRNMIVAYAFFGVIFLTFLIFFISIAFS